MKPFNPKKPLSKDNHPEDYHIVNQFLYMLGSDKFSDESIVAFAQTNKPKWKLDDVKKVITRERPKAFLDMFHQFDVRELIGNISVSSYLNF